MFPFEDTIRYIDENLYRDLTIKELAEHCGYSEYHFCRLFKSAVGQTVGTVIKQRRLLRILRDIQSGAKVTDTVMYYGFETYAGFYKAFIRMFGCPPKEYISEHPDQIPIEEKEEKRMKICETERCVLSHLSEDDFGESLELLTDERVREYLGGSLTEEEALRRLKYWTDKADSVHYTVRLRDTREFIGIIAVTPHHNGVDKELSYQFLPEYWREGYALETASAVLRRCRAVLRLGSIVAETQTANDPSCRLLEKLGFVHEETLMRFGAEQFIYRCDLCDFDEGV